MKKTFLLALMLVGLLAPPALAQSRSSWAFRILSLFRGNATYKTRCLILGGGSVRAEADPVTVALLQRIADQQAQMVQNQLLAGQQIRPVGPDPQLAMLMAQLSAREDRIVDAINANRIEAAGNIALMKEMIAGQQQMIALQQQMLTALQAQTKPTSIPPIIITPLPQAPLSPSPGTVPTPGSGLSTIPNPGAGVSSIPGPGGSVTLIPSPGGSLSAIPEPGGSLHILPGGVKPPDARPEVKPDAKVVPGAGNPLGGLPGIGLPMTPLPLPGDIPGGIPVPGGTVYKFTYFQRR